ncbi:MAG: GNAT family N-acetyltransferase [Fimbriiglobus sp.]
MISYRRFLNTDPPGLLEVWNDGLTGRGAFPLRTPGLFERWLFSKTYFDPNAVVIAEDAATKRVVGFALAGSGPNVELTGVDPTRGIIAFVVVRQDFRRKGIGRELVRRAETYLKEKGATELRFGSLAPNNPYGYGLYGGANSPGILASESTAAPFLRATGYVPATAVRAVMQKQLDAPLAVADPRFGALRKRYDVQFLLRGAAAGSWWQECVWGTLEPSELKVFDRLTGLPAARAVVWELEGFSWRWGCPSAGIYDVQVRPDLRRQGLAKLVLLDILRFLQEQFFGIAELHVPADDPAAVGLCKSLGFTQVDTGRVWVPA